jgi:hypothetical protein
MFPTKDTEPLRDASGRFGCVKLQNATATNVVLPEVHKITFLHQITFT